MNQSVPFGKMPSRLDLCQEQSKEDLKYSLRIVCILKPSRLDQCQEQIKEDLNTCQELYAYSFIVGGWIVIEVCASGYIQHLPSIRFNNQYCRSCVLR